MAWPPQDAEELRTELDRGTLRESRRVDFKAEVPTGKGARKGFVATLASFAVHGGWVVVGVAEPENNETFVEQPVPLDGLREQVDALARDLSDPPLYVETTALPIDDERTGFLLVRIPQSPQVVHAVDGRYYGRRDTAKSPLSDAEVEAYVGQRRTLVDRARGRLASEASTFPTVDHDEHYTVHVRLDARSPVDDLLWDATADDRQQQLHGLLSTARQVVHDTGLLFWSLQEFCSTWERRVNGYAYTGHDLSPDRSLDLDDGRRPTSPLGEVLFDERGAVQTWVMHERQDAHDRAPWVTDQFVVSLAMETCAAAGLVAEQVGFDGIWDVAIRIEGLQGLGPRSKSNPMFGFGVPTWPDPRPYEQATSATARQLREDPQAVVTTVLASFMRTLRSDVLTR